MREILFRAKTEPCSKDAISGKIELVPKWVYGYIDLGYMQDEKGAIISDEKANRAYRCQYSTIGQYTGLTDKNGRRIFEGDIIKMSDREIGAVAYSDDCAGYELTRGGCTLCLSQANERLVIGNIHDNPDLLKEE